MTKTYALGVLVLLGACTSATPPVEAQSRPTSSATADSVRPGRPLAGRPDVEAFVREMAARNGFDAAALDRTFSRAQTHPEIIEAMDRPAETKPWSTYRKIFLTEKRIQGGADFMRTHAQALAAAQARYGVPAEYVTAIIGVETQYGANIGKYTVFEALATLAFDYPRRADYFRKELEQFLLLAREEGIDPLTPKGSYAGAMGLAQFMPSSYRKLAIDFDADGHRNLWTDPADAIGSVANYLAANGWKRGDALVALPAHADGTQYRTLVSSNFRQPKSLTRLSVTEWRTHGVSPAIAVDANREALLLELDGDAGPEAWLAFDNFYAITRYNLSALYAMAVYQLGDEIRRRR